jgi:glycosyltransferase involved in cell wall biosynthesis
MKIYTLLGSIINPQRRGGDKINELAFFDALSKFADVYYANRLWGRGGLRGKIRSIQPNQEYDFYYLRGNPDVFRNISGPKAWLARPYDEESFKTATAVVTLTESWKWLLQNFNKPEVATPYYRGYDSPYCAFGPHCTWDGKKQIRDANIHIPDNIVTFDQVVEPIFKPLQDHPKTLKYRRMFRGDTKKKQFLIGHFGRVSVINYPFSLIEVIKKLRVKYPDVDFRMIYAGFPGQWRLGKEREMYRDNGKVFSLLESATPGKDLNIFKPIPHDDVPYAISACDITQISGRTCRSHWGGSRRVLESMACGVPVLSGDFLSRREQLGDGYKLLWDWCPNDGRLPEDTEEQMMEQIELVLFDSDFYDSLSENVYSRSKYYSIDSCSRRYKKIIQGLCK